MTRRRQNHVIGVSIGIVAREIGIHPQTLRDYERKGLVVPHRTPGGARRYRESELARLRRIQQLTELGMSLAGVEHVLRMEAELAQVREWAAQLEQRLRRYEHVPEQTQTTEPGSQSSALVRRSMSVEIVHVPRRPRGPRWSSSDHGH